MMSEVLRRLGAHWREEIKRLRGTFQKSPVNGHDPPCRNSGFGRFMREFEAQNKAIAPQKR